MGQQEAWITLHMFRAAFVFWIFNGIAAVTKPLGFGETDLHEAISSGCLARQKEYRHPNTQMEGLATFDFCRWSVSTIQQLLWKVFMWLQPLRAIFFFVKGFFKEASASLLAPFRWPWVVSLWRGLASALPYQCVVTSLVVKDWCPLATKMEGKIKVFWSVTMAANISLAMKHNDTNELSYLFSTNSEHQQLLRCLYSAENALVFLW